MNAVQLKKIQLISITLILVAYFLVWLPNPAAGLKLIAVELGEWAKFLSAVDGTPIHLIRYFFFLPPISIAITLHLLAFGTKQTYQIWGLRILATLVSLLISPSLEQIQEDPIKEWIPQILLILLPIMITILCTLLPKLAHFQSWLLIASALIGFLLPLVAFMLIHPTVSTLFGHSIPISPGIILNSIAHLALAASSWQLRKN